MFRWIAVSFISLVLFTVVRSDEPLRCYTCTSLTNPGCDTDPKAHNIEPVECTLNHMVDWQRTVQQHSVLNTISNIFDVDNSQHYQASAPMACAKMVLKVNNQEVTVRHCQTAKTETIDPCKAIQGKFSSDSFNLQHCELCMQDACNDSTKITAKVLPALLLSLGSLFIGIFYNRS